MTEYFEIKCSADFYQIYDRLNKKFKKNPNLTLPEIEKLVVDEHIQYLCEDSDAE